MYINLQKLFTHHSKYYKKNYSLSTPFHQPFLYHIGTLLCDHYDRSIGITTDYVWHNGAVYDSKSGDSVNSKPRVYYS